MVGKQHWNAKVSVLLISDFVTFSDEAFALLLIENSWDTWKKAVQDEKSNVDASNARRRGVNGLQTKYTCNGAKVRANGGWRKEGHQRFRELKKEVIEDRKNEKAAIVKGETSFESVFLENERQICPRRGKAQTQKLDTGDDDSSSVANDYLMFDNWKRVN